MVVAQVVSMVNHSTDQYSYQTALAGFNQSLGIGLTLNDGAKMSDIISLGGTGVFFVNGDFTVDQDNIVTVGKYLMIITKGTITFDNNVNSSAGIFMADSGIVTSPAAVNTPLIINGILYSVYGNIRLDRGFVDQVFNNTQPGVVIKYRPDFIFNLPGNLFKIVRGFRQL